MHSYYSNKSQSVNNSNYTIMVAEVASTVNEIILAENILKKEKDIEKRKNIISELIGTITSTLVRQSMFAEFERKIHDRIFMEVPTVYTDVTNEYEELLKKYFANITIDEKHKYEWLRIPHFYRPYYVYKYATGISSAIYIARNILNNKEGYLEKYLEMLLKIAEVDLEDEKTYDEAFKYLEEKILELEELVKE